MDNRNQSAFQFSNPVMLETHFQIHWDFDVKNIEEEMDTPVHITFPRLNKDDFKENSVFAQLTVEVGEDNSDSPYYLSVTMGANFKWDETFSEEQVQQMLSRNAPMLLLAYARPLVAQITGSSPVGPVHIPFMNFLQQKNED